MDVLKATKEDFENVAEIKTEFNKRIEFGSVVIVPQEEIHESGYRQMHFVLMDKENNPIGRVCSFTDAIYIEPHHTDKGIGRCVHMDLLPCGLTRFWVNETMWIEDRVGSDLDVYYIVEKAKGW